MSKDHAARIADTTTTALLKRDHPSRVMEWEDEMQLLTRRIRRAITTAVRKERERCVGLVEAWCDTTLVADRAGRAALKESIVDSINGGKR